MKKLFSMSVAAAVAILGGCSSHTPGPGEEVVFVMKPVIFGSGGVDMTPAGTGLHWTALSTSGVIVNVKPYQLHEPFDDLITKDNNPVDFSVYISVQHIAGQTPILIRHFGDKWYENKLRQPLGNFIRDFTKGHTMFEMTTDSTVTDDLQRELLKFVQAYVKQEKIPVLIDSVTVGRVAPPAGVLAETIATAQQKQRKLTEDAGAQAELARKNREENKASADVAYLNTMSMNADQYIRMREIENSRILIESLPNLKNAQVYIGSLPSPIKQ